MGHSRSLVGARLRDAALGSRLTLFHRWHRPNRRRTHHACAPERQGGRLSELYEHILSRPAARSRRRLRRWSTAEPDPAGCWTATLTASICAGVGVHAVHWHRRRPAFQSSTQHFLHAQWNNRGGRRSNPGRIAGPATSFRIAATFINRDASTWARTLQLIWAICGLRLYARQQVPSDFRFDLSFMTAVVVAPRVGIPRPIPWHCPLSEPCGVWDFAWPALLRAIFCHGPSEGA